MISFQIVKNKALLKLHITSNACERKYKQVAQIKFLNRCQTLEKLIKGLFIRIINRILSVKIYFSMFQVETCKYISKFYLIHATTIYFNLCQNLIEYYFKFLAISSSTYCNIWQQKVKPVAIGLLVASLKKFCFYEYILKQKTAAFIYYLVFTNILLFVILYWLITATVRNNLFEKHLQQLN
ncbi:hypothetical protein ABPG74_014877 [Tetrahymena malaccensis]